jgi:cell division protein FtsW
MRAGQGIIVISITLLMLGVIMVNSAGMQVSNEPFSLTNILTNKPTMLAFFAIIAMFIGSRFPLHFLEKRPCGVAIIYWLLPLSLLLLMMVYVPGVGKEVNYSQRWIDFGGINFQPSEIAKWVMVAVVAWWSAHHFESLKMYWRGFIPPLIGIGAIAAIIAVEDLGTAVLIFATACFVLFAAGSKLWHFATFVPVALGGFYLAVYQVEYRMVRLLTYLDPFNAPEKDRYHIMQSMSTISEGGLSGLGLGSGIHKFGYLPEDTTDFIYAVICEELGIFGSIAVAALYIGMVALGVCIIRKTKNAFQQLFALGIIVTIGLQAGMNILVVTALIPTKGIALPLLSNGGTGWLLTAFCIGLLNSIDRKNDTVMAMPFHQPKTNTMSHA